jgi:trypsin
MEVTMPLVRWMLALLALLLLLPASAGAIVNGTFDSGAHPYVGTAVAGDVFCSGSLVTPTLFITAGHCSAAFAGSGETTFVTFDAHARPTSTYVTGTPYTHPDFFDVPPQGMGVPASVGHDVGVVVLDDPVELARYAALPSRGELTAHRSAAVSLVGYGADGWITGGGRPFPTFSFDRMIASSRLIDLDPEFARFSTSPGQGNGGIGPGDSGSPALRRGTDVVTAIGSHGPSPRASGNSYWYRLDTADARSFLERFTVLP